MKQELGIVMAGFSNRAVPMAVLESARKAVEDSSMARVLALGVGGAVAVVTCHRVELYVEGAMEAVGPSLFGAWSGGRLESPAPMVLEDGAAARHLLRVAAGLEAAGLGDENVLGQLRSAYRSACDGLSAGPLLHRMFHTAFRTGKRVRTETGLGRGGRSLAGEAVVVINRALGGLAGRTVLVLGAGEMARTAAERLAKRGVGRLVISNRSLKRAKDLAAATGGEVVPWSWRARALRTVDAMVVGTGAPEPVLGAEELRAAAAARGRLVAVDLSLPRNLEPPAVTAPGLELIDLVKLTSLLEGERERRQGDVALAETIVDQETEKWLAWARNRRERGCRGSAVRGVAAG